MPQLSAKIVPHFWYVDNAEAAAAFYVSLFPDSKVDAVTPLPTDSPSGPAGSVKMVEFILLGAPFIAIRNLRIASVGCVPNQKLSRFCHTF